MNRPFNFLCISFFFKGGDFLEACKQAGNTVYLLTKQNLEKEAWPWDSIEEVFYMESEENTPENFDNMAKGLAWLLRTRKIDRIVALDDFDVEKAAFLREEFRIPGMGQTTARFFRDKLAMRIQAQEAGIKVPPFCALFNDEEIKKYLSQTSGPWVVKPRAEASATGIKKVHTPEEFWEALIELEDTRYMYLVEQFKPGAVYHVDSLSVEGKVVFCRTSKYLNTPFEVAHGGGVFRTSTLEFGGEEDRVLQELNAGVMTAFGMKFSASHTEFIKADDDGEFYFLETSSRVGGAHIAEMVEISSGINLWEEWAKIETAMANNQSYQVPAVKQDHAGLLVSLSRFQHPDTSSFTDPEIQWRINKEYHIGFIVNSNTRGKVISLLDNYTERVFRDFHASAPAPDKSTH